MPPSPSPIDPHGPIVATTRTEAPLARRSTADERAANPLRPRPEHGRGRKRRYG